MRRRLSLKSLTFSCGASVVDSNSNCLLFGTEVRTTDYEPKLVINCFERISQNTLVCNMSCFFASQVQNNWRFMPNLPFVSDMWWDLSTCSVRFSLGGVAPSTMAPVCLDSPTPSSLRKCPVFLLEETDAILNIALNYIALFHSNTL